MPSEKDFQDFYHTDLKSQLRSLENKRKKIASSIYYTALPTLLGAGGCFFIFQNIFSAIFTIALGAGIGYLFISKPYSEFKGMFKQNIIGAIVQFIHPNLNYSPFQAITENCYYESRIFPKDVDRYKGDDYICGNIDKTQLEFSELHTEYKTTQTDSKGRSRTNWHTIFKGLFFCADFNKDFHGQTFILPDTAQSLFGKFGQTLQSLGGSHGQLVKLEDPEFEEAFVCYGSDQTEARYILTPSLMERILTLRNKASRNIHLSFVGSKVYLAISTDKDLFEASLFSNIFDIEKTKTFFEDMMLAIGVVEDLNLNTRIWTKQ